MSLLNAINKRINQSRTSLYRWSIASRVDWFDQLTSISGVCRTHRWNRYRRPAVPVRSGPVRSGPVRYRSGFRTGRSTVRPVIHRSTGHSPFDRSYAVRPVVYRSTGLCRSTGHSPFDRSFAV